MEPPVPRLRPAVRALVVTPDASLLLVRFRFRGLRFWAPPGGGIEPGESEIEALRRELAEEVGLTAFELGPVVYTHERSYVGRRGGQRDVVYRVDVPSRFLPDPRLSPEELLAEHVTEVRWLCPAEQRRAHLLPFDLASIVADRGLGPTHLDDMQVPPVVVAVSGPDAAPRALLARAVAAARGLPFLDDAVPLESSLHSHVGAGRSVVVAADAARLSAALGPLRGTTRFQVVGLALGHEEVDAHGPHLTVDPRMPDMAAALACVDTVLPPS